MALTRLAIFMARLLFRSLRASATGSTQARSMTTGKVQGLTKQTIAANAGAAPHPPFGHLLPVNGAKDALIAAFANRQRCRESAGIAASPLLPVHGEKVPAGG